MKPLPGLPAVLIMLLAAVDIPSSLLGEERNRLSVTVAKKTLENADGRSNLSTYSRIDRTQGLKVTVKNVSFKDMKEGELDWSILVRPYNFSTITSYSGTEKVKALKPAESQD